MIYLLLVIEIGPINEWMSCNFSAADGLFLSLAHLHRLAVAHFRQVAPHNLLRAGKRLPRTVRPSLFSQHLDPLAVADTQFNRQTAGLAVLHLIAIGLIAARHVAL